MQDQENARIFGPYFNGGKDVYADPLEVYQVLQQATRGQLYKLLAEARQRGPEDLPTDTAEEKAVKAEERQRITLDFVYPALERLGAAARPAFKMLPFDADQGAGATLRDCTTALFAFMVWLSSEKKTPKPVTSAISSAPTAPASSPSRSASSSDCGCS